MLREWILVAASLVFYAYGDLRFLPVLVGSIIVNWLLVRMWRRSGRLPLVGLGIALNLTVLTYFKYWDFFGETLAALFGLDYVTSGIILPIGISFFTFQQLSYLIDLKRGLAPAYGLRRYALYISVFPQLIAGPVVRHNELIPQLESSPRRPEMPRLAAAGAFLFLIGLIKKVLIADPLERHIDAVFAQALSGPVATLDALTATASFALQIYFDYSAYSDMAIGLALLLGFRLPYNFNAPYQAISLRDFWRRWHMTLSRFFRDYLYIPLGGNRRGFPIQMGALMLTMGLCGLWHGAGWTFVLWGAMHGVGLVINNAWRETDLRCPLPVAWLLTIIFVLFSWVLFRAESMVAVHTLWMAMAGLSGSLALAAEAPGFEANLFLAAWAVVMLLPTSQKLALDLLRPWRSLAIAVAAGILFMVKLIGEQLKIEFIYFAF